MNTIEIKEVTVNGQKVKFQRSFGGIHIPFQEIENKKPIIGSLAKAYFCDSSTNDKKWKVQIGNKALAIILKKEHLAWFKNRADAEKYVKHLDSLLTF
jgi:hypothetical protein